MFAALRALAGGKKPIDVLPTEAQTCIASAMVFDRTVDKDFPRVLMMTAYGAFYLDERQPRGWLKENWPHLSEAQNIRALKLIDARVCEVQREQLVSTAALRRGTSWRDWRPAEKPTGGI